MLQQRVHRCDRCLLQIRADVDLASANGTSEKNGTWKHGIRYPEFYKW